LCFLCFFEAFVFFFGSEIVVDASLDVCTVKLSRFVLYNRLQDLGSSNCALTSWSVLFSFSSNLERKVV
jgi:membrane protein YqaA with SNARE-associated domain